MTSETTTQGVAGITEAEKILFGGMSGESTELERITLEGEEQVSGWKSSMQDFFSGSYKYNPKLAEANSENGIARRIMNEVMQTREFKEMREFTRADSVSSAMAAKVLGEATLENLPEEVKEASLEKEMVDAKIRDLLNEIDPRDPDPETKAKVEELIAQSTQIEEKIENADLGDIRRAVRVVSANVSEKCAEVLEGLSAFGIGSGEAEASTVSASERIELAKRLRDSRKLKEIAEIAGRLTRIAMRTRETRVSHGRDEIHDVEQGDDLGRVLPSELIGLAEGGEMETLFLRKYAEKELLQYAVRGTEEKGRGPIIVCLDESGSMNGNPEFFGKGITLALLMVAKKEKRDFAFIRFGRKGNSETTRYPKGQATPAELMDLLEKFLRDSGTDFETPLTEPLNIIEENEFKDADVIFITDGGANLSDKFVERFDSVKAEKKFDVFSIVIGKGRTEEIQRVSDRVSDWASPQAAREVFEMAVEDKSRKR